MYKPPENCNRVKSIKSIFENNTPAQAMAVKVGEKRNDKLLVKSKTELHLRPEQNLSRQLSDPSKRNIKRTPAFRLDKTSALDKNSFHGRSRYLDNKLQPNLKRDRTCDSDNKINECLTKERMPQATKFADIRSKFANGNVDNSSRTVLSNVSNKSHLNQSNKNEINSTKEKTNNVSFLYSEPIPKALRVKKCDIQKANDIDSEEERFCNKATLKLTQCDSKEKISAEPKVIENKKSDDNSLTDTLKIALKKPLPPGPAPKKPPRTFIHSSNLSETSTPMKQTISPLNFDKEFTDVLNHNLQRSVKSKGKSDPKYMLDKLETALRNNKIRLKKSTKTDHTSGEESDENSFIKTKCKRVLPVSTNTSNTLPRSSSNTQMFNLNCLNALGCANSAYERVKEPNSCFFVDCKKSEPVYAEPFQYRTEGDTQDGVLQGKEKQKGFGNVRNSLYYMVSLNEMIFVF